MNTPDVVEVYVIVMRFVKVIFFLMKLYKKINLHGKFITGFYFFF